MNPCLRPPSASFAAALLLAALPGALPPGPRQQQLADYEKRDVVGGSWVSLASFPVRPMVFTPSGALWVVNHHDSTIERFFGTAVPPNLLAPDRVYGVPWSPVAIGYWPGNGAGLGAELLVVCRGSWVVVGINPSTGAPTRLLQLRPGTIPGPGGLDSRIGRMAEPGDILVDEVNHRAFVSCSGADSVMQIDLNTFQVTRVFNEETDPRSPNPQNPQTQNFQGFRMKSPLFLSWEDPEHQDDNWNVLVAPLHSGNNTLSAIVEGGFQNSDGVVTYGQQPGQRGLPDEDLFRIKPYVSPADDGDVEVVAWGTGTTLFAHGRHKDTGEFWQLNTNALNAGPQSEPGVQGNFIQNRVTRLQNTSGAQWSGAVYTVLDPPEPNDPPTGYTTSDTVGQPFGLTFSRSGHAFITGLLTDNVLVLGPSGAKVMEFNVRDGMIPRGILEHPTIDGRMFVYGWGSNEVRSYDVNLSATPPTVALNTIHSLRYDPTPPDVAAGRRVFFDGTTSEKQNASCASCHIEAGNDFLVWNLSNMPLDDKGPMFTQTLVGLQKLAPFHWRGERQLIDFKGAFRGLLGAAADNGDGIRQPGEEPTVAEFARFEDFVFSLNNPANPNQNRTRRIDSLIHHLGSVTETGGDVNPISTHVPSQTGNATLGQGAFKSPALVFVARHSCVDCHDFPTGTNNDINVEQEGSRKPRRISMKPTPFHEIWRKSQTLVDIIPDAANPPLHVPYLGSALSHVGQAQNIFEFVSLVIDEDPVSINDDRKANNIADLLHQWDQGLGLAAHYAFLLNAASSGSATAELNDYLMNERQKGNCDVAVVGMSRKLINDLNDPPIRRRWVWDRAAAAFVCDDPTVTNRSLADFLSHAPAPYNEANIFLGLPPGMGERFAVDYDMDGVKNRATNEVGTEYNPALPLVNNGFPPAFVAGLGPVVEWESTRIARVTFTTNEPTWAEITYDEPSTATHTIVSPPFTSSSARRYTRFHSVLLTGMRPSTSPLDEASSGTVNVNPVISDPPPPPINVFVPAPGYEDEPVTYTVTVTLWDVTGTQVSTTPFTVRTDDFIVPAEIELGITPTPEDLASELKNQRTHIVDSIGMQTTIVGALKRYQVNVTTAFKRGSWTQPVPPAEVGTREPAAERVVFGRVFIRRDGELSSPAALGLNLTTDSTAERVEAVRLHFGGEYQSHPIPADNLVAGLVPTNSSGETSLAFFLPAALMVGDEVVFNVEGVLQVDLTQSPFYTLSTPPADEILYRVLWRGAFNQWSFPDTGEAKSSVTVD